MRLQLEEKQIRQFSDTSLSYKHRAAARILLGGYVFTRQTYYPLKVTILMTVFHSSIRI